MEIKKKAVIVNDEVGMPNYMTMFYLPEGEHQLEDVPEMFRVNGAVVPAVLISQYTNTVIDGNPCSLPYQQPTGYKSLDEAAAMCRSKGRGWHLMTNTEWVYLLDEADRLGHIIGGNTNYGKNAKHPEEKGVKYDDYFTLTGLDPLAWSHDGTKGGVFGLCGNFWEWALGLRLNRGGIEYIKDNDAAAFDPAPGDPAWKKAEVDGKWLRLSGGDGVTLKAAPAEKDWDGCHYSELKLDGLEEVPEILHKLRVIPRNWKEESAGIWADSALEEAVPIRGSGFHRASSGGVSALGLGSPRSSSYGGVSFRSALILDSWELVTELL